MDRSSEMLISILGILKSGSAYVPIDSDYPQDRIDYMINDSGCEALIDVDVYADFNTERPSLSNSRMDVSIDPSDLCYVIYTSGTTGKPKGVMVDHASMVNRVLYMIEFSGIDESDNYIFKTINKIMFFYENNYPCCRNWIATWKSVP